MKTLVTGGAGYIGSHFVDLLKREKEVVVFDNLSRGHREAVPDDVPFEHVDITDSSALREALAKYNIDSVVHFAAFAYVGESVQHPDMYYKNNVWGSINLISACAEKEIKKFVFSSTCSLYGNPENVPISESATVKPINPYACTKMMIENVLSDFEVSHGMKYAALRYFNASGAEPNGKLGESHDPEPHLIPLTLFSAMGKRDKLSVFGDNYKTPDGTCVRDYIHIVDLADAHLRALKFLEDKKSSLIVNLGTGTGNSVMEIIKSVERITGLNVKFEIAERRAGDPAVLVADNKKALE